MPQQKEFKEEGLPAQTISDPSQDTYSMVDDSTSILSLAGLDLTSASGAVGPAAFGPKGGSLNMVECELYSEASGALEDQSGSGLPDISPYACFYGAPKHQTLKVGWLDKLSPQG